MDDTITEDATAAEAPKKGRRGGGAKGANKVAKGAATRPPRAARAAAAAGEGAEAGAGTAGPQLRKKDLIERVTAGVGGRKGSVKDIVEATLKVLGEAVAAGESLNVPPFGRARISKPGKGAEGKEGGPITLKLRRGAPGKGGKKAATEPLAEAEDQG